MLVAVNLKFFFHFTQMRLVFLNAMCINMWTVPKNVFLTFQLSYENIISKSLFKI